MVDSRKDVLVVDDDYDVLLSLQDVLEMEGQRTIPARNGLEALELLRRGLRPAVILLDLMMPGMNGWQFLAERRRDEQLASTPVVVLSGQGLSTQEVEALGVEGYLKKPVELERLLATVEHFVTRAAAADEQRSGL